MKDINVQRHQIQTGQTVLGIEFGSTRIKGVLLTADNEVLATGGHAWENLLEDGIWTYPLEAVWNGLRQCYAELKHNVRETYDVEIETIGAIGVSAMMHGYLAFDDKNELLVPFRTWRNTMTEPASVELTELFEHQIPQRWSIAHLYQAILNEEEHVERLSFFTTLAGYVHWKLTGKKVLGLSLIHI